MATETFTFTDTVGALERFPDFPSRDDMQNWKHLYEHAVTTSLIIHFGDTPNVIVANEVPVGLRVRGRDDVRIPDLMVIFDADRKLMEDQRGYEIDRHGKPPNFALEVASHTTGVADYTSKRLDYERCGVSEYWRFDPSGGQYHDAPLAGDRMVDGRYERVEIETVGEDEFRGYSEELGLYLCWEHGELRFFDPKAWDYLRTHAEETARAELAEARAAELEAEIRRLRGE